MIATKKEELNYTLFEAFLILLAQNKVLETELEVYESARCLDVFNDNLNMNRAVHNECNVETPEDLEDWIEGVQKEMEDRLEKALVRVISMRNMISEGKKVVV